MDARPNPLEQFRSWLDTAEPGESYEYHRGFLAVDRSKTQSSRSDCRTVDRIGFLAWRHQDRVRLVQKRHGDRDYSYLAVRRGRP